VRVILEVPTATLELANLEQVAYIDEVEVGRPVAHTYPLPFESRSRCPMQQQRQPR